MLILIINFGVAFIFAIRIASLLNTYYDSSGIEGTPLDSKIKVVIRKHFVAYFSLFILVGMLGTVIKYKTRKLIVKTQENRATQPEVISILVNNS